MGVNIVDPNEIISSDAFNKLGLNGAPDQSGMYIFVELTAKRRSGSVIVSTGNGSTSNTTVQDEQELISVNMMGFDKDSGNYTTKWSHNSYDGKQPNYEGFGITDVKININSSYVPVVDIEFIDIRGAALFSPGDQSQYAALFSFPPPVFTLTVKGYYGKALKYDLHLVRQSTKTDGVSGNFYVSASFVAQKFAPLTDTLFKYIDVIPLIDDNSSNLSTVDFDFSQPVKSTRELIIRTQKLYDDIDKFKTNSDLAKTADSYRADYTSAQSLIRSLNLFRTSLDNSFQSKTVSNFFIRDVQTLNTQGAVTDRFQITTLPQYQLIVRDQSPNLELKSIKTRLFIVIDNKNQGKTTVPSASLVPTIMDNLNRLKKVIIDEATLVNSSISAKDNLIKNAAKIVDGYYGIDITDYYIKVLNDINTKQNKFNTKQTQFKDQIDNISVRNLGQSPTIGSIFKVLCDDVDKFYKKLKDVDTLAEAHHAANFNRIVSDINTKKKSIAPFPLIKKRTVASNINNPGNDSIDREERAYPEDVFPDIETFPEVDFVESFITTYLNIVKSEELLKAKENLDDKGNNKWVPITPFDSEITGNVAVISPYFGKFSPKPELISEILNRFYITTQYSFDSQFYANDPKILDKVSTFFGVKPKQKELIQFLAKGEAANLVSSIVDSHLLKGLSAQASNWKANVTNFYTDLQNNTQVNGPEGSPINIYNTFQIPGDVSGSLIDPETNTSFLLINNGDTRITKDRKSAAYVGFDILEESQISFRNTTDDGSNEGEPNPVDEFLDKYTSSSIKNFLFQGFSFDSFTKQNVMYNKDEDRVENTNESDFLSTRNAWDRFARLYGGNQDGLNIAKIYATQILNNGLLIKDMFNDSTITDEVKAFVVVSLFGYSATYYDEKVNLKFSFPAVVEVPKFAHAFMGGLTYFFGNTTGSTQAIDDFNAKYGKIVTIDKTYVNGLYVRTLSANDKNKITEYFTNFVSDTTSTGFGNIRNRIISLIDEIGTIRIGTRLPRANELYPEIYKRLINDDLESNSAVNPDTGAFENDYSGIITRLSSLTYVLNYTQRTFYPQDNQVDEFIPLSILNNNTYFKQSNDSYFIQFFSEVIRLIELRDKQLSDIEKRFQQGIEDKDIKTQCYYSFKNISDRWVLGFGQEGVMGNTTPLFNDFLFVDRAFNDISDKVVIDVRPLIEMSKDFDVSVFTVMSKILSLNGFEFFPLQNFMDFKTNQWEDCFRISDNKKLDVAKSPKFVCMYIGGLSSQLNDSGSDFDDDGVRSLESLPDFKNGNVFGFKVSYGKQNQSLFTDMSLNTNEHKETNESLSILSEIAQDQSVSSPVPKGQNLFSTYEQRSYSCRVDMLGNMMIQPTQYFMLESVPMFDGAYLILHVEHSIVANFMKTSFEGVRIKKYPQPFVRDFSTSVGVKGGSSDSTLPVLAGTIDQNTNNVTIGTITTDQSSKLLSP